MAKRMTLRTVAGFLAEQLLKTARRPSRLIYIPINLSRLLNRQIRVIVGGLLFRLGHSSTILSPGSPLPLSLRAWPWGRAELIAKLKCEYSCARGIQFLDANKVVEAWRYFSLGIDGTDDYICLRTAAACLHVGLGRMREAIALQRRSDEMRFMRGASLGFAKSKYFVLDYFWIAHIGHAAQVDYIAKLAILDGRDPRDTILFFPPESDVGNRFLVNQWAPHLRLVTSAKELPFSEQSVEYLALNFYCPGIAGHEGYFLWELAAQTYRRWHEQARKPLLGLSTEVDLRGRDALASVGVPRDAWFVGLHVREPHYSAHHRGLHDVLNANIEDYVPAIREITRRGGWVIRMGDPAMTQLPPMPNVLDYCHSAVRADWMDVFLAASCRFFLGTSSGPCYVPQNYGVPCVLTNWWPPAQRPWQPGDIFVPKLLRRIATGEFLSLEESLDEPFGYCNSVDYLSEAHAVAVMGNDPEDIRSAVVEMLDRLAGEAIYDERDIAMRERAEHIYATVAMRLYNSPGAFGSASLARDFLRRHSMLLSTRAGTL